MEGIILVVDDEQKILKLISEILEDENIKSETAQSGDEAIALLKKKPYYFSAMLLDIWMDGLDGLQVLEWTKQNLIDLPIIMMSGHSNIETAVKATKLGAYDFIEKPPSYSKLILTISHALRESALLKENKELKTKHSFIHHEIVGKSENIQSLNEQINVIGPSNGWVLINGENGTGKELVAKQIHLKSLRHKAPFIDINCAAIPENLIESELFGHEKGAFTGASIQRIGKFDQANGGTLFLDEIGDMSLNTQAKILRVLQEQKFERVGGNKTIEIDVRVIAASNKILEKEIDAGHFREDLFYRLNVIPITVPPLRERKDDIKYLSEHFINIFSIQQNMPSKVLTETALKALEDYHWPGNIRELRNIIERMMILVSGKEIELKHVPPAITLKTSNSIRLDNLPSNYKQAKKVFEKMYISDMLLKNEWNITQTAESIQIERSNLHKKIKYYDIELPSQLHDE